MKHTVIYKRPTENQPRHFVVKNEKGIVVFKARTLLEAKSWIAKREKKSTL